MLKYTDEELTGYGFDIQADRVVKFTKHADGVYLNTRATYSINQKQYTHFELRSKALLQETKSNLVSRPKASKYTANTILIVCVLLFCISVTECSVKTNISVVDSQTNSQLYPKKGT